MTVIAKVCAYPTDWGEEQSLHEIITAAGKEGIEIAIDRTMSRLSEVGLFLGHHKKNIPSLSNTPIIMLHDLGQAHNVWPKFWDKEPWNEYAYGILPNRAWLDMYQSFGESAKKPAHGVRVLGWPKSDSHFKKIGSERTFSQDDFKNKRLTVLYAPSWEFNNQQDQLVQALRHLPIQILVKQQYWEGMGHMDRVNEMAQLHGTKYKNVTILDPRTKIFEALSYADCIVSDESSTLIEGFFYDCYPIAIKDWKVPDVSPPRPPSVPFPFVKKVLMADLEGVINSITDFKLLSSSILAMREYEKYLPENRGYAANAYADFIRAILRNSPSLNVSA